MNLQERISLEKRVVRHLIRVMKLAGWAIDFIDDGEKVYIDSEKEAMDTVFSVDDCKIYFRKGQRNHWVFIVLGNDGWDAIADYSYSSTDDFEKTMEIVNKYADYLCDENT